MDTRVRVLRAGVSAGWFKEDDGTSGAKDAERVPLTAERVPALPGDKCPFTENHEIAMAILYRAVVHHTKTQGRPDRRFDRIRVREIAALSAAIVTLMTRAIDIDQQLEHLDALAASGARWVDVTLKFRNFEVLPMQLVSCIANWFVSTPCPYRPTDVSLGLAFRAALAMRAGRDSKEPGQKLLFRDFDAGVIFEQPTLFKALLELPRSFGVDVDRMLSFATGSLLGELAEFLAKSRHKQSEDVMAHLFRRVSSTHLNGSGRDGTDPLIHKLLSCLWCDGTGAALRMLAVCCGEDVCPSDGSGLDLSVHSMESEHPLTADEHAKVLERVATATVGPRPSDSVFRGCSLIHATVARIRGYRAALAGQLAEAFSDTVAVPPPVQHIIATFVLHPIPL
jgi:hypothetical protein